MELTVRDRQSLWDIAVQYLGGVEGVFLLAARNGIEVTSRLKDGQRLEWKMMMSYPPPYDRPVPSRGYPRHRHRRTGL